VHRKPALVILLGAGASKVLGLPLSKELNPHVDTFLKNHYPTVHDALTYAHPKVLSGRGGFEDDINTLESLISLTYNRFYKTYISSVAPLVQAIPAHSMILDEITLNDALDKVLQEVEAVISSAQRGVARGLIFSTATFFNRLAAVYRLKVYTVNYDTTIDQMLACVGRPNDGYAPLLPDVDVFSAKKFFRGKGVRLAHLHGSLDFGFLDETSPDLTPAQLVKPRLGTLPRRPLLSYIVSKTAATDFIVYAKIVTGLRKLEKTKLEPYGAYSYAFASDLLDAGRLLVIGYSGNDLYLNLQIERAIRFDPGTWRSVLVTNDPPKHDDSTGYLPALLAGLVSGPELQPLFERIASAGKVPGVFQEGSLGIDINGWRPHDKGQMQGLLRALRRPPRFCQWLRGKSTPR